MKLDFISLGEGGGAVGVGALSIDVTKPLRMAKQSKGKQKHQLQGRRICVVLPLFVGAATFGFNGCQLTMFSSFLFEPLIAKQLVWHAGAPKKQEPLI